MVVIRWCGDSGTVRGEVGLQALDAYYSQSIAGGYLTTSRVLYDTGMVKTSTDPKGGVTSYSYSPAFAGAFLTQINSPDTGTVHHIVSASYDFNTGLVANKTGDNSEITSYSYDNVRRLTGVNYPDGGQTTYTYSDAPPLSITTSTLIGQIAPTYPMMSKVQTATLDGLGRATRTQLTSDPEGVTSVDTTYGKPGDRRNVPRFLRSRDKGQAVLAGLARRGLFGPTAFARR